MALDAHDRAFAFLGGACQRGIYDNMKTAVDSIFVGRERQYAGGTVSRDVVINILTRQRQPPAPATIATP